MGAAADVRRLFFIIKKQELTDKEILYIEWLNRMDYEAIKIFVKLFADAGNSKNI